MYQTHEIVLWDLSQPVRKRHNPHTGPYRLRPGANITATPDVGGYMSNNMLNEGSTARLRIEPANNHLEDRGYGSLTRINGYYIDDYQDETLTPMIARLPHGRGYLAGYTMGEGMATQFEGYIYADVTDAATAAHSVAEYAAEAERDYQREHQADEDECDEDE